MADGSWRYFEEGRPSFGHVRGTQFSASRQSVSISIQYQDKISDAGIRHDVDNKIKYIDSRLSCRMFGLTFFLMRAMALPGLRPLGHVLEQFMIVWQRYSLKESSRAADS